MTTTENVLAGTEPLLSQVFALLSALTVMMLTLTRLAQVQGALERARARSIVLTYLVLGLLPSPSPSPQSFVLWLLPCVICCVAPLVCCLVASPLLSFVLLLTAFFVLLPTSLVCVLFLSLSCLLCRCPCSCPLLCFVAPSFALLSPSSLLPSSLLLPFPTLLFCCSTPLSFLRRSCFFCGVRLSDKPPERRRS